MYLKQILITSIILLSLTSGASVSAKSGEVEKQDNGVKIETGSQSSLQDKENKVIEDEKEEKGEKGETLSQTGNPIDGDKTADKKLEIRLKKDINAYIIESYKAQGNKIIKDLSIKLGKTIPDGEERKIAYEKIRESLKIRLEKTEETSLSSSKKEILQEFLEHLIHLLDKKIEEIEK